MALKGYGTLESMHRSKVLLTSPANPGKDSFGVKNWIHLFLCSLFLIKLCTLKVVSSNLLKFWAEASFSLLLILLDVENKTRGHATVSSVTDCLNTA